MGFTPIVLKLPKTAQAILKDPFILVLLDTRQLRLPFSEFNKKVLLNFAFFSATFGLPSFTIDQSNGMLYKYESDSYVVELKKIPPPVVNERTNEDAVRKSLEPKQLEIIKEKAKKKAQKEREEAEAKAQAEKAKLEAERQAKTEAKLKAEQQAKVEAESRLEAERKRLADEKAKD